MIQDRRDVLKSVGIGAPLIMAGMGGRAAAAAYATNVSVAGNAFHINGQPTYPGRSFRGNKVEGLLFTSRMVNCIINDQNPETRGMWAWRDGPWDPERNTSEFIAALPRYRSHGLTSVAFNIQGGSPMGYGWHQPWHTSGYSADGRLLPDVSDVSIQIVAGRDASANFDMQSVASLLPGDCVRVRRSQHQVHFLHPRGWSYYGTLRKKLHWHEAQ